MQDKPNLSIFGPCTVYGIEQYIRWL